MKILVIGGGGREHALVWKLSQNPHVEKIFCAPGNPGIAQLATCIPIKDDDLSQFLAFAKQEKIDLTVVGPEKPLVMGIVDLFEKVGLAIFGPSQAAAQIEGSKSFAKEMMKKFGVPTAQAVTFDAFEAALDYAKDRHGAVVVKADGLAAGKGVSVCRSRVEAETALAQCFKEKIFGSAGEKVVLEEVLVGQELSVLAFVDGENVLSLVPAQDHKAVFDGDRGPNTGGMGAYSPVPFVDQAMLERVEKEILRPMVRGLKQEGIPYRGILYAGLMLTSAGPKVVEFNCRFGDPETQVVLPRLASDLVELMHATLTGSLHQVKLSIREESAVCVVLASGGYPGTYQVGVPVSGLEKLAGQSDVIVFHAGTKQSGEQVVTAGGRVLGITALAPTLGEAIQKCYQSVSHLSFAEMHYRSDIGRKALVPSSSR